MKVNSLKNRVLVVGGSGFIGGALTKFLVKDYEVISVNSRNSWQTIENQALKFSKISRVYWCASSANPVEAENQPELLLSELRSLEKLIANIKSNFVTSYPKLVFLSSAGCTYTSNTLPFRETDVAIGTNTYGRMKLLQEEIIKTSGIPYLILRISNVYGPGQAAGRGQGLIANLIDKHINSESIEIFGELKSTRDYVYISDVVRAIYELSVKSEGIFNIGSGSETSIEELLEIFKLVSESSVSFKLLEKRVSDRDSYFLDISKVKSEVNWIPEVDLQNGIKSTIESWRRRKL